MAFRHVNYIRGLFSFQPAMFLIILLQLILRFDYKYPALYDSGKEVARALLTAMSVRLDELIQVC